MVSGHACIVAKPLIRKDQAATLGYMWKHILMGCATFAIFAAMSLGLRTFSNITNREITQNQINVIQLFFRHNYNKHVPIRPFTLFSQFTPETDEFEIVG